MSSVHDCRSCVRFCASFGGVEFRVGCDRQKAGCLLSNFFYFVFLLYRGMPWLWNDTQDEIHAFNQPDDPSKSLSTMTNSSFYLEILSNSTSVCMPGLVRQFVVLITIRPDITSVVDWALKIKYRSDETFRKIFTPICEESIRNSRTTRKCLL